MDIQTLRNLALFKGLPVPALEGILTIIRQRTFIRDDVLFTEGEQGQGIWILNAGTVKLIRSDSDGREHLVKIVKPHEVFAEVVLFDGGPYPATAVAADNGIASVLYNRDAEQLMYQHPALAWHFLRVLSRRLRAAQERVRILSATDVAQKLAAILLHLSEEQDSLTLILSHRDLANMIGTARETVSRALASLAEANLVTLGRNRVKISDKLILAEIANK